MVSIRMQTMQLKVQNCPVQIESFPLCYLSFSGEMGAYYYLQHVVNTEKNINHLIIYAATTKAYADKLKPLCLTLRTSFHLLRYQKAGCPDETFVIQQDSVFKVSNFAKHQ